MSGHAFKVGCNPRLCAVCGRGPGEPVHLLNLFGEDAERQLAMYEHEIATAQAEELTEQMRRPIADISTRAGRMERESPLFFGTGNNPLLF